MSPRLPTHELHLRGERVHLRPFGEADFDTVIRWWADPEVMDYAEGKEDPRYSRAEIEGHFAGKGYGDLKKQLAEVVIEGLRPLQTRYGDLTRDPATLDEILRRSAEYCESIANPTLRAMQTAIGLR